MFVVNGTNDSDPLLLTLILAIAAIGLVMTALTHAELRRRPVRTEPKWADVPSGLNIFIRLLVIAIVTLFFIGVVGWIGEAFK
jgi:uncharacterized protein involved in cysteine biosynthesis